MGEPTRVLLVDKRNSQHTTSKRTFSFVEGCVEPVPSVPLCPPTKAVPAQRTTAATSRAAAWDRPDRARQRRGSDLVEPGARTQQRPDRVPVAPQRRSGPQRRGPSVVVFADLWRRRPRPGRGAGCFSSPGLADTRGWNSRNNKHTTPTKSLFLFGGLCGTCSACSTAGRR